MRRREMAGCGHPLPFAAAAGLALGLALFAHQLLLTLAAVVIGPLPAVQTALTALYLSRKDLSENAAQAVSEPAQETQAEPAQEAPALPAGDMEAYLVPLEGDEARPEGAGAILEKNYPQGSGEKYIPCGSGRSKKKNSGPTIVQTTPASPAPTLPPRSPTRSPLRWSGTAPTRRSSSCTPMPLRITGSRQGCGTARGTVPAPPTGTSICALWAG